MKVNDKRIRFKAVPQRRLHLEMGRVFKCLILKSAIKHVNNLRNIHGAVAAIHAVQHDIFPNQKVMIAQSNTPSAMCAAKVRIPT